jgi:hypothetical protein
MLETQMGRLGVDFPLADFLTDAPDKSVLFGVTSGREVNTVMIEGVRRRHLLSLPRCLIATYRSLPGRPNFVGEFSDWNLSSSRLKVRCRSN